MCRSLPTTRPRHPSRVELEERAQGLEVTWWPGAGDGMIECCGGEGASMHRRMRSYSAKKAAGAEEDSSGVSEPDDAVWREMWDRVRRWYGEVITTSEVLPNHDVDSAYAFFVFCYHLKDWIKNDPSVDAAARQDVEPYVESEPALSLAGDIANGAKHLLRNRPARIDDSVRITTGESSGGYEIVIVGDHGTRTVAAVADHCLEAWGRFLMKHGLL